ncbi:DUF1097 domain-containing protein [Mycobacterium sp. 21AC1]|uniref:DUF1097 domain-containing protein n=1 Tax=[Mycobacterium] appelbergii TaxID=2939269 RepID=UPI0029390AB6|nr:DUF1097 domain-containing protein [Mycobacterium sp. 21AC1]MDV3126036.1 DUF1097 domain-containing protein [Mycobacterium sp. 21AC1]
MPARLASTVAIGLLAGLSCLLTGFVVAAPIWVLFIAWASFFAAGGGLTGAARSLVMLILGVASATATMMAIGALGGSTWAVGGCVIIGAGILVFITRDGLLSFTPAGFFGFASVVGTLAATGTAITAPVSLSHPVLLVLGALLLGTAFGLASERLGGLLTTKTALAAAES